MESGTTLALKRKADDAELEMDQKEADRTMAGPAPALPTAVISAIGVAWREKNNGTHIHKSVGGLSHLHLDLLVRNPRKKRLFWQEESKSH